MRELTAYTKAIVLLGAVFVTLLAILDALAVHIDWHSIQIASAPLAVLEELTLIFIALRRFVPSLARSTSVVVDMMASMVLFAALAQLSLMLSYVSAALGGSHPMIDDTLLWLDASVLHFDWQAYSDWVWSHALVSWSLMQAYNSIVAQSAVLLILGSLLRPGDFNREFFAIQFTSILLLVLVFPFVEAYGHVPHGRDPSAYLPILHSIRAGTWSTFTFNNPDGIVTFPSYHTALAVMFTYVAARTHRYALAVFAPLNFLMLLSVCPFGGHYLTDMIGGAAIALASILTVRLVGFVQRKEIPAFVVSAPLVVQGRLGQV